MTSLTELLHNSKQTSSIWRASKPKRELKSWTCVVSACFSFCTTRLRHQKEKQRVWCFNSHVVTVSCLPFTHPLCQTANTELPCVMETQLMRYNLTFNNGWIKKKKYRQSVSSLECGNQNEGSHRKVKNCYCLWIKGKLFILDVPISLLDIVRNTLPRQVHIGH